METLTLNVYLPCEAAIKAGTTTYGTATAEVSDAMLTTLSDGAKVFLAGPGARCYLSAGGNTHMHVEAPGDAAVCVAIEKLAAEEAAEAAKAAARKAAQAAEEAAKHEERVAKEISKPDTAWILHRWDDGSPSVREPDTDLRKDPRIVARRQDIAERVLPGAVAAWKEERARVKAAQEAAKASDEAKKAERHKAIREVARTFPSLTRAADEGYPITRGTMDALARRLLQRVIDQRVKVCESQIVHRGYDRTHERPSPSAASFAVHDAAKAAVEAENKLLPEIIGQWDLSRILSVDVCPGHAHYVTCVLATLKFENETRQVVWALEKLSCNRAHDDE